MSMLDNRGKPFSSLFHLYRSFVQVIPSGAWTTVQWDGYVFDILGETDIAATYSFTPREAGYYMFHVYNSMLGVPANVTVQQLILINGVASDEFQYLTAIINDQVMLHLTTVRHIDENDIVTVQVHQNSGFNQAVGGSVFRDKFIGYRIQ